MVPSVEILDSRKRDVQKAAQRREPQYSDKGKRQAQSEDKLPKKQQHGTTSHHWDVPEKDKRRRKRQLLESDEDISSHPKKQKLSKELAGRMKDFTTSKKLQPDCASDSGGTESKGGSEVVPCKERKKKGRKERLAASVVEYPGKPHFTETTGEQASDFVISAAGGLTTTDKNSHSQAMIGKKVVRDTKTKRFKGHSGVVAMEEIRKGKKCHSLPVDMVDFESELGSGQTSSWT